MDDYAFPSRVDHADHISTRQYARLVMSGSPGIGLGCEDYGTHSLVERRHRSSTKRPHHCAASLPLLYPGLPRPFGPEPLGGIEGCMRISGIRRQEVRRCVGKGECCCNLTLADHELADRFRSLSMYGHMRAQYVPLCARVPPPARRSNR